MPQTNDKSWLQGPPDHAFGYIFISTNAQDNPAFAGCYQGDAIALANVGSLLTGWRDLPARRTLIQRVLSETIYSWWVLPDRAYVKKAPVTHAPVVANYSPEVLFEHHAFADLAKRKLWAVIVDPTGDSAGYFVSIARKLRLDCLDLKGGALT